MPHSQSFGVDSFVQRIAQYLHPQSRPLTVLIVDDEAPIRKFVERILLDAGFRTAIASDGAEALEVAAALESIDVLVTDLMMPTMNGDELARRLRAGEPALKVLYLTGYSDKLFAERILLREDEAFIDKPCTISALLEALSLLVSGHIEQAAGWATTPAASSPR